MAFVAGPTGGRARDRFLLRVAPFAVGALIGAIATEAVVLGVIWIVDMLVGEGTVSVIVCLAVLSTIAFEGGFGAPVPYRQRQVPEIWGRQYSTSKAFLLYGGVLGIGFATVFTSPAHLAFVLGSPLILPLPLIAVAVIAFVAGKTVVLAVFPAADSHERVKELAMLARSDPRMRMMRSIWGCVLAASIIATLILVRWS